MLVFWQPEKGRLPVRVGELLEVNHWNDEARVKSVDGVHDVPFVQLRWLVGGVKFVDDVLPLTKLRWFGGAK